jgi:hopanoid-associated phosphorylase
MTRALSRRIEATRNLAAAPVLVVTGLSREAACAAGDGLTTICSGADVAVLAAALEKFAHENFAAVVSFGLAGGLDPKLRPGDVVVGAEAAAPPARFATHSLLARVLVEGLSGAGGKTVLGGVAGVDAPVLDVPAKALLRAQTQAVAVDMESHIAAAYAEKRGLPFAILRVVCDPASRALPALAASAIKPDGGVDIARVMRELAREPMQIGDLIRAGADARAAFASLRRCGRLLGPLLRLVLAQL